MKNNNKAIENVLKHIKKPQSKTVVKDIVFEGKNIKNVPTMALTGEGKDYTGVNNSEPMFNSEVFMNLCDLVDKYPNAKNIDYKEEF